MKHFSGLVATLAACSAALFGAGGEWQAFVTSEPFNIPGAVVPIGLSSYVQGNFVSVDAAPTSIAITPDAKWALVTDDSSEEITVLALTESPITTYTVSTAAFGEPTNIGITPDGKRAVVICSPPYISPQIENVVSGSDFFVATLDLTKSPFSLEPSTVQVPSADSLAITPDGKRALIGSNASSGASLTVVDLTTTPISIDANFITGFFGGGIAVTPDGKMALGVVRGLNAVTVVDLTATPNPVQIHTVFVGNRPIDIAITPDGKKAFVTCVGSNSQILGNTPGIAVLDLTTTPVSVETPLVPLSFAPRRIAIDPDGKKAVVTAGFSLRSSQAEEAIAVLRTNSGVSILDLTTSPISVISTNPFVIPAPTDVAITPDQAPTARFTSERDGDKVTFNASSSTSPIGEIAKYKWNFGDGHKKTTTSPIVTHKYHDLPNLKSHDGDKPIMVTLTVTNTAGTSTDVTFTGRTVSNNGGPSAVCRQPLIASPQNFTGTIKMGHGKKNILLKTTWTKSPTKGIKRYEIFAHDKKIASISAKDSLHKTIRLNNLPEEISNTVLQDIVGPRYRIRAVVDDKVVSPFVSLTVVQ
jgi:DNA-binding beta-propeller fold protein YncE